MKFTLLVLAACAEDSTGVGEPPPWADVVLSAPGASDAAFGDPSLATNGARGAGWTEGSFDVYALDVAVEGDTLALGWSGRRVVDGPGPDLVVFENAFALPDGSRFMDPTQVEVSADGATWAAFAGSFVGDPEDPTLPEAWAGFAGVTPTLLHLDDNPVDPFDTEAAGGDAFDLADLPDGSVRDAVLADGIVAVRLGAAGEDFPRDAASNGPDIDAVYAREWVDAP